VAQAQAAHHLFRSRFAGPRWDALVDRGARVQRPLWASTSTKDPSLPDTLYVDSLIGPDTINTMPEPTIAAFQDHGTVGRTVDHDVDRALDVIERLGRVGVDLADVARTLEQEGVASFAKSFDELMDVLRAKGAELVGS
jgi:transaldolase